MVWIGCGIIRERRREREKKEKREGWEERGVKDQHLEKWGTIYALINSRVAAVHLQYRAYQPPHN